ncbi:MAG: hypothetical protein M0P13_00705 [Fibrobacteraceae bacterium]|nr:hypothetical protein [Fibrobacteraceae bacterium]
MKKIVEIGGNFPLEAAAQASNCPENALFTFPKFKNNYYTFSGRTSISLILKLIKGQKKALLPDYTCDSCITPFFDNGYSFSFYKINSDLTPDIGDFSKKAEALQKHGGGVLFLQTYFGFDSLQSIRSQLQKYNGITFVEDTTHSWLSTFTKKESQFYVTSLRKWLGIPDGGVASTNQDSTNSAIHFGKEKIEEVEEYAKASALKQEYLKESLSSDIALEKKHYPLFKHTNSYFNETKDLLHISSLTKSIIQKADFHFIKQQRRENYQFLLDHVCSKYVQTIYKALPEDVVPLYFPIIINSDRSRFQKHLASKNIFCPFHWPVSPFLEKEISQESFQYRILSVVCDQRYSIEDMDYISKSINQYEE